MAAEPVPVLRPGLTLSGVDDRPVVLKSTSAHTGKRKIGSYLTMVRMSTTGPTSSSYRLSLHTGMQARTPRPMTPSWRR